MTKHFEFKIMDDDTILRDGETLTVKQFMRDSKPLTALEITDAATKAVIARDAAAYDATHKPGWHYAGIAVDSRAEARAANRQASLDAYDRDITTAWMGTPPVVTDAVDPRTAWHDAHNAGRAAATTDARRATLDAAYLAADEELQNAWRKPAQF
jgi:hypothetical protein